MSTSGLFEKRVRECGSRRRFAALLASSSLVALLIGGGARPGLAACITRSSGTVSAVTNSGALSCISISNATVTGSVTNTSTGVITGPGTTVAIENASIGGAVINAGTITAFSGNAIAIGNNAAVSGGINNSASGTISSGHYAIYISGVSAFGSSVAGGITNAGTISANNSGIRITQTSSFAGGISNASTGVILTGTSKAINVNNVSLFSGGINNAGTISSGNDQAIYIGTLSTFSGGITNSGQIAGPGWTGIQISGVSTFSGGIVNSNGGTITGYTGIKITGVTTFGSSTASGGIANAGTISASNVAVSINSVSTFTGGITNSGTISASNSAVNINSVSTFTGGITNSGTISVADVAINIKNVSTFSGAIVNSSLGSITGIRGIGISNVAWFGQTAGGGITNAGTISARQTGIYVNNVTTFSGNISNAGTIATTHTGINISGVSTFAGNLSNAGSGTISGNFGVAIRSISTFSGSISNAGAMSASYDLLLASVSTFTGGISNSGALTATAGSGIYISSVGTFADGVSNGGTISAFSGIYVTGVSAFSGGIGNGASSTIAARTYGIYVNTVSTFSGNISNASSGVISSSHTAINISSISTFSGNISNAGTISSSGYGVLVNVVSTFAGGMTNSGTITASGGSGMYAGHVRTFVDGISNGGTISALAGIYIEHISAFSGGISNSSTIVANTYGIYSSNNSTFSGGISNSGAIASNDYGIIVGQDARSHGAVSNVTFSGGITNSGAISAAHTGIYVNNVSSFSGNISNAGTITGVTAAIAVGTGVTFAGGAAIVNSGIVIGSGGTAIDASAATSAVTIDQTAGTINGAIRLSANADVLNISGGSIAGNIVGLGTLDTINFSLGSGNTFTYGSAFSTINQVNVDSGKVVLNGANSATKVDVSNGGTLAGTGSIDPTTVTIHSGGTFAPGNGTPGTSMAIIGNLALQSGATYQVYVNPGTSSFSTVSGTASLSGTVNARFATGSYISKVYTILSAGSVTGTFGGLTTVNLPSNFTTSLSYDTAHAYLDLTLAYTAPRYPALNVNQSNVADALINSFDSNGRIPTAFGTLSSSALSQVSGEAATSAQWGAFQLTNDFLNLMLDPMAGGGGSISSGSSNSFAPEQDASLPPDVASAYGLALHQQPQVQAQSSSQMPESFAQQSFDQRWSTWGSAFGGKSLTDGNAVIGSNNVAAIDYGFAGGMDYHATPDITYGFGLAGGGTSWNLAQGLDGGRSDAFAAGVYAKTHWGPLYVSGALAFANHWFTTDRFALGDQLRASFAGQNYAARLETGYRYAVPIAGTQDSEAIVGVTPYAALQAQAFHTPSYSETDLTGGGFALAYNAMNATDTRSELGLRFDNLQVVDDMPLILRDRVAWAHDWATNPALGATFEALPVSNFTVNGAAPPKDSVLTTAAAELHISPNWTAMAKFDGAFAAGGQSYGGSGTLKYSW